MSQPPENNSQSSQATTSTTTSQDVAEEGSGVSVGAGASYVNTFNPDVAATVQDAIDNVFGFGANVLNNATQEVTANSNAAISAVTQASNNSNSTASEALNNAQLGQSSLFTNPAVIFGIVAVVGIFAFLITKRR